MRCEYKSEWVDQILQSSRYSELYSDRVNALLLLYMKNGIC